MTNRKTYLLVNDDDGHWFIIPEEKATEFNAWLKMVYDDYYDGEVSQPEWVKPIDGPHSILIHAFSDVCN